MPIIWEARWSHVHEGMCRSWHRSKAEALQAIDKQRDMEGENVEFGTTRRHDIPTTKKMLMDWLNDGFYRDDG